MNPDCKNSVAQAFGLQTKLGEDVPQTSYIGWNLLALRDPSPSSVIFEWEELDAAESAVGAAKRARGAAGAHECDRIRVLLSCYRRPWHLRRHAARLHTCQPSEVGPRQAMISALGCFLRACHCLPLQNGVAKIWSSDESSQI